MARIIRVNTGDGGTRLVIAFLAVLFTLLAAEPLIAQSPGTDGDSVADSTLRLLTPRVMESVVNDTVEIRLRMEEQSGEELVLALPEFEEGIVLQEAPVFVRRGFGQVEARLIIRASVPGRYLLRGLGIRRGISVEAVDTILLEVADRDGDVPFSLRWRVLVDEAWVGQSIPVVLEMYRIDEFAYPDSIDVRAPEQGLFEEVAGLGSVRSEIFGDVELFEVPVAGFLFTPGQVGRVEIPPAEVSALGFTIRSDPGVIQTGDIPTAAATTIAVGSFAFSVDLSATRLDPGESDRLVMTVQGQGNLPVLAFPELEIRGLSIIEETEEASIAVDTTDLLGYSGTRTRTVRFEPDGSIARSSIAVAAFPFFNPRTDEIIRIPGQRNEIDTPMEETEIVATPTPEYQLIEIPELSRLRWYPLSAISLVFWALLFPPVALGIAFVIRAVRSGRSSSGVVMIVALIPFFLAFRVTPELDVQRLTRAHELATLGRPAVAGVLYDFELDQNPENAALHYNRGVLALRSQDAARSVFHFRRAVRIVPESELFRAALDDSRDYFELPADFPIPQYPRPMTVFLVVLILWSMFCVGLFLRGRTRRAIALLTILFLQLLSAGGLIWSYRTSRVPEATVLREAIVRRIPDPDAIPWVQLEPATVVMVELGYEEFYLIRTGNGVTGWIPVSAVDISVKERS